MIEFAKRDSRRTIAEKRQQFESRLAKIKQDEERLKQAQDSQERPRKKQVRATLLLLLFTPECNVNGSPDQQSISELKSRQQSQSQLPTMMSNSFWTTMTVKPMRGKRQASLPELMVSPPALSLY